MSSDIAIKVDNLSKCFYIYEKPQHRLLQMLLPGKRKYGREFWALKGLSFEVKKGETVGIIGRNGSGKSTLLQIICGTRNPTQGQVTTNGRIAALLELGSGFNPEFTGRENIYLNASVLGLSQQQIDARYEDIVAFADIGDFVNQPVKTYSSGMTVRLAFAVIAHVDADILIIDEALAVGDTFFTQKCMRFLRHFMQTGTVLFVSHDTNSVKSLCNRALWLEGGQIMQMGTPKEICEMYLEAFFEAQHGKTTTTKLKVTQMLEEALELTDQRLAYINASNLRNDLQIFEFDPEAASFGKGGAQIIQVQLLDTKERPLAWVVGGEKVLLRLRAQILDDIAQPIMGFYVKDRLGQYLFGDNTYLSYREDPLSCTAGSDLIADFIFQMPILHVGDYSICAAIASGCQEEHVQQHWIHDALLFRSEATSAATGLVGIPMLKIALKTVECVP